MRRDLIIGVLISLVIHGGVAMIGKAPPKVKKVVDDEKLIQIEIPKVEPDEPEIKDQDTAPTTPLDFAPPMQNDTPQLVTDTSFVQQLQPPPPEGLKPSKGVFHHS